MSVTVRFLKEDKEAFLPEKAHTGSFEDAAYDLYLPLSGTVIRLAPGERRLFSTGLKALIPSGYWVKFHERSGLASKAGIQVLAGVIDNTYTGLWKVLLFNCSDTEVCISPGQAVAQFTIETVTLSSVMEVDPITFEQEEQLRSRKDNGFGSTDK